MENTIMEMKNTLEGIKSSVTKEKYEYVSWKTEQWKLLPKNRKKKKMKRNEDSFRNFYNNIKEPRLELQGPPKNKRERV